MRVGNQDAPLFFVGPGQINAQMPFEVSLGDSVPIAVSVGGLLTAPQNYLVAPAQPAIFSVNQGQAGELHRCPPSLAGRYETHSAARLRFGFGTVTEQTPKGESSNSMR